jgi:hypothetical protein
MRELKLVRSSGGYATYPYHKMRSLNTRKSFWRKLKELLT